MKIIFDDFIDKYLGRFSKYYRESESSKQRSEIKKSIFDNENLTETQKEIFWEKVLEKAKNKKTLITGKKEPK